MVPPSVVACGASFRCSLWCQLPLASQSLTLRRSPPQVLPLVPLLCRACGPHVERAVLATRPLATLAPLPPLAAGIVGSGRRSTLLWRRPLCCSGLKREAEARAAASAKAADPRPVNHRCDRTLSYTDQLLCTKRRWGFGAGPPENACFTNSLVRHQYEARGEYEEHLAQGLMDMADVYCKCGKQAGRWHACMATYRHAYRHAYIHTCMHTCMHAYDRAIHLSITLHLQVKLVGVPHIFVLIDASLRRWAISSAATRLPTGATSTR